MSDEIKNTENATPEEALTTVADIKRAIEAILFAAGYPMAYDKLGEVLGLTVKDVKTLVADMAKEYDGRGISLLLFPDTCQLCTKERFMPYIREALGIRRGGNLSASSMEVLAIVAYNQPVTRAFIDQVRGVDSNYAVNSLIDKGLIESSGRLDAPGRPMLYATTDKFLRVFGLNSLDDLPETEPLVDPDAPKEPTEGEMEEPAVIVEGEDSDVKIADGKIDPPANPDADIEVGEPAETDAEDGGEVENSQF